MLLAWLLALISLADTSNTSSLDKKLNFFEQMEVDFYKIEDAEDVDKAYEKWKKKFDKKVARRE